MYEVGQVLYTINNKKKSIFPIRVVEQVIKKSIEGETTEYTVEIPGKNENKYANISNFKNLFLSLEEVKEFLVSNAKSEINNLVERASAINNKYFPVEEKIYSNVSNVSNVDVNNESCNNNDNNVIIDLGDGQKGKISINNLNESLGQKKT